MAEGIELSPEDARAQYCYLITTGRISGKAHEVEMWFAVHPDGSDLATLFALSGGRDRSDWVKNLHRNPNVTVRIHGERFSGRAHIVEDDEEDELARHLLVEKYERDPGSLANWGRTALPVAVELAV